MKKERKDDKQKTDKGQEIPIPKKGEFFDNLKKVVKDPPDKEKSRRSKGRKKKK